MLPALIVQGENPRIDRGAALQVRRPRQNCWSSLSYHGSASEAFEAFDRLSWLERTQHSQDYRVVCHSLDVDFART